MKQYDKLIFVDREDTSVAPMAEAIMMHRFLLEDILIESRGLIVLFPEPVNMRVEETLHTLDLTLENHASRQLSEEDFDERTLILTMTEQQKEKILSQYPGAVNVYSFREYVGADEEVMDPYGGSSDDYRNCFEQLWFMTNRLADILKQEG